LFYASMSLFVFLRTEVCQFWTNNWRSPLCRARARFTKLTYKFVEEQLSCFDRKIGHGPKADRSAQVDWSTNSL
jgi:hypothetical protein